MYTSEEALPHQFGNNGLIDVGPLAVGDATRFRVGLMNATKHAMHVHSQSSGSKISIKWLEGTGLLDDKGDQTVDPGKYAELLVSFKADSAQLQEVQTLDLLDDGASLVRLVVNYIILPEKTQTITVSSGQVRSGLGKVYSGEKGGQIVDWYILGTGAALPLYTLQSAGFSVDGGHDHRCSIPDNSRDQYAKCRVIQTNNEDVIRQFSVQGVDGGNFGIKNDVNATATLTATYGIRYQRAPTLLMVDR